MNDIEYYPPNYQSPGVLLSNRGFGDLIVRTGMSLNLELDPVESFYRVAHFTDKDAGPNTAAAIRHQYTAHYVAGVIEGITLAFTILGHLLHRTNLQKFATALSLAQAAIYAQYPQHARKIAAEPDLHPPLFEPAVKAAVSNLFQSLPAPEISDIRTDRQDPAHYQYP